MQVTEREQGQKCKPVSNNSEGEECL
jgi:hypothetical protein